MIRSAFCCILFASILLPVTAAKRRFDERGNILPETAGKDVPAGASVTPNAPATSSAATEKAPAESATAPVESGAAAAPATANPAATSDAAEAAREEAAALAAQKHPQTKVYLENAQLYLWSNRLDKALEFLKKSQEAGEDEYSREARLIALGLRARRGDAGLEGEAEGADEKLRVQALLRIADGYHACAKEILKKNECLNDAERIYAYISELQPRSMEGKLARLRLGLLLLDTGRHEAALPHLTRTLMAEGTDLKTGQALRELPLDRAWFNLGQLYERPWYHRDTHKAQAAYKQVLKYSGSPYQQAARERLASLERFGVGYNRP
jgi:tetratricopeptide (TPR) repeat protein